MLFDYTIVVECNSTALYHCAYLIAIHCIQYSRQLSTAVVTASVVTQCLDHSLAHFVHIQMRAIETYEYSNL